MSNVLPAALLRPCAALRPGAPTTHQWTIVTSAFARRFCSSSSSSSSSSSPPPCFNSNARPSLLSIIQSRQSILPSQQSQSFSTTPRPTAKVANPPSPPQRPPTQLPPPKKRTVKIGPLPTGEVDSETIQAIFGHKVSHTDGNNILRILHHRRMSGSLADYGVDNLGHKYAHVNRILATKALEWLREAFPVDEGHAAEMWAEKEANRIAYELWLADPENDSKYKDPARAWRDQQKEIDEEKKQEDAEGQRIGMLRAGPSQFERNIAEKRRQRLEEATRKAEEKEKKEVEEMKLLETGEWVKTPRGTGLMKPGQTAYVDVFGREQISQRKEIQEAYRKKAELPFKTPEELLASTTLAQRIYPMTIFVALVCFISYTFVHYYEPPSPSYRLWPDVSPTTATLAALISLNLLVWIAWRVTPLWPFLTRNFMHTPAYPRFHQSVTNVFTHVTHEHFISNMFFLVLVGSLCHELVGRGVFVGTYISAGALGTLASLYWANLGRGSILAHSVGASAAIYGIVTLYLSLTETERIQIPFMKDMSVSFWPKSLLMAVVGIEIYNASRGRAVADHASHFGGMATGMVVAAYMQSTGWNRRRMEVGGQQLGEVQRKAGVDEKTIDLEALVKEEAKEVKESVKKVVK